MLKNLFIIMIYVVSLKATNIGSITTGSKNGTYIEIGNDISVLLKRYNVDLNVLQSKGSLHNLKRVVGLDLLSAQTNWAIVQADALKYYKYQYFKATKKHLTNSVKIVLPLYNEDIHIFSKKGNTIDFNRKKSIKVGVKSKKSGGYVTSKVISNLYGIEFKFVYCDFSSAQEYLKKGVIDIFIDVTAKPNKIYKNLKNIDLVNLPNNKLMQKNYHRTKFTKKDYPWIEKEFIGYASPSVLVTSLVDKKYNNIVEFFLKVILKHSLELKKSGHSKWSEIYQHIETNTKMYDYHPSVFRVIGK